MRDTARALALDRDIDDIKNGVEALAASRHLDGPVNLAAFYDVATAVSKSFGGWAVLSELSGRQVLNTSRPLFSTPWPGSWAVPTAALPVADDRYASACAASASISSARMVSTVGTPLVGSQPCST